MQALILAGGSGTRFWPLSRRARPKQFLALDSDASLLQRTVARLAPLVTPEQVWISTTESLAPQVREQLPAVPAAQILTEPTSRNTAPAIGWSLLQMHEAARGDVVAVLPSDHRIADDGAFRAALADAAEEVVATDRVMTLGVTPTRPETGYGYLQVGAALGDTRPTRQVVRFTEKPDLDTARAFLATGDYLWNAGMFVFRGTRMLQLMRQLAPELGAGLDHLAADPGDVEARYAALPSISIDYAVMEPLEDLGTLPLDCGWSDIGAWDALAEVLEQLGGDALIDGDVQVHDAAGSLVWNDAPGHVAVVGVEDVVVVRTADAVLVVHRERAQDVRTVTQTLQDSRRDDLL